MVQKLYVASRKGLLRFSRSNDLWVMERSDFVGDPVSATLCRRSFTIPLTARFLLHSISAILESNFIVPAMEVKAGKNWRHRHFLKVREQEPRAMTRLRLVSLFFGPWRRAAWGSPIDFGLALYLAACSSPTTLDKVGLWWRLCEINRNVLNGWAAGSTIREFTQFPFIQKTKIG
jgi:hypothetical protein